MRTSLLVSLVAVVLVASAQGEEMQVAIKFTGGHETDRQDGGRPVVLVAAALGVKTEEFRKAFSGVTPARGGKPTGEQARKNKDSLLKVLEPLGVANERLDEVSDYYRYRPESGELWKNTAAEAHAIVEGGKIKKIVITKPGAGYSSTPTATVTGMEKVSLKVTVNDDKDLKKNGSVTAIEAAK